MQDNSNNPQYLMKDYDYRLAGVLIDGRQKLARNGMTRTLTGVQMRFDLSSPEGRWPILTRRAVKPAAVFAELCWMMRGKTDRASLNDLGCSYWDKWFNDKSELGPTYGRQMRAFGDKLPGVKGFDLAHTICQERDQLKEMAKITELDPSSRRNMLSLWDPSTLSRQVMPPCATQFQVLADSGSADFVLTMRSLDMWAGAPADILLWSTLGLLLVNGTGLKPREFILNAGDCHLYENQTKAAYEYLSREIVPPSPLMKLACTRPRPWCYEPSDFMVLNYSPLEKISAPVSE